MALFGFEMEEIARLIALVDAQGLDEFIYEEDDRYLRVRGRRAGKESGVSASATVPDEAVAPRASNARHRAAPNVKLLEAEAAAATDKIVLESPMVGVFYRAEKPGAPPLVSVGDRVEIGQTVGVLEAMKVFSEFIAEHAGVIVSIPAQDGVLVQAGAPLLVLKKDA